MSWSALVNDDDDYGVNTDTPTVTIPEPKRGVPPRVPRTVEESSIPLYLEIELHGRHREIIRNSLNVPIVVGEYVMVEADRGYDLAKVVNVHVSVHEASIASRQILRKASSWEVDSLREKRKDEEEAVRICKQKVKELNLPMTITTAELQFDGKKLTIYFSAKEYVDFRFLVQSLFKIFGTRIWMIWCEGTEPVKEVFKHGQRS